MGNDLDELASAAAASRFPRSAKGSMRWGNRKLRPFLMASSIGIVAGLAIAAMVIFPGAIGIISVVACACAGCWYLIKGNPRPTGVQPLKTEGGRLAWWIPTQIMQGLGILLLLVGVILLIYYWLIFDTSVSVSPDFYFASGGITRVNNIGLMADRQNGLIVSGILIGIGFACTIFGRGPGKKS